MHRGISLGAASPIADDGSGSSGSALGSANDKISLWAPGRNGARVCLESLLGDAMQYTCGKDKEKTAIFSYTRGMSWDRAHTKPKRSLESVILPSKLVEEFKKDVRRFLDSADWYQDLGIPYSRSYLLHGPVRTNSSTRSALQLLIRFLLAWVRKDLFRAGIGWRIRSARLCSESR